MKKLFLFLILGILILAACGGEGGSSDDTSTLEPVPAEYSGRTNPLGEDASTEGAKIFKANCETCHGPLGRGDGPAGQALDPKPRDLSELQARVEDDYLFWRIAEGKPGTSMVAWKGILADEQIWQAVAFIRMLK
jgi:mono/diheme cytochrome c family protein